MRSILGLLLIFTLISCEKQKQSFIINWDKGKAVSVSIQQSLHASDIRVNGSEYAVLCSVLVEGDLTVFTPPVPFERGQSYDVFSGNNKVLSFAIPLDTAARSPEVLASYPSCDTVPENLLKMYLMFDQPMMEGRAYNFIHLLDNTTGDTVDGAFLDLQPELWNEDQTVLTLWLDPGRIKQDLIPNKSLGTVLNRNRRYELVVSPGWKSKSGLAMDAGYVRHFVTKDRDTVKPDKTAWAVGSGEVFELKTGETLDWLLLNSAISAWSEDNQKIAGTIVTEPCERGFRFVPREPWPKGKNRIEIESRLEDLAGNNLNRLFETDVTKGADLSANEPDRTVFYVVD